MFTWKTLNGKNHGSPQTPTITIGEKSTLGDSEAMTLSSVSSSTRGYNRNWFSFSSLSLSLYTTMIQLTTTRTTSSDCPKSYLYLYDFKNIYKYSLYRHTRNIFADMSLDLVHTGSIRIPSGSVQLLRIPSGATKFPTQS